MNNSAGDSPRHTGRAARRRGAQSTRWRPASPQATGRGAPTPAARARSAPWPRLAGLACLLTLGVAGAAEPKSVDECIAYAVEHSPRLLKLQIEHENQELQTTVRKAVYSPSFRLDTSRATDADADTASATVTLPTVTGLDLTTRLEAGRDHLTNEDSAAFSVRLSKQILGGDSWRERQFVIEESLIDEVIALNHVTRQKRQLVLEVKRAFYQIIRDIQSLPVQERGVERAKKNLQQAIEREKPLDINTARIQVPENELSLLAAQRVIAAGLDSLKVTLGMPVTEDLRIQEVFEFRPVQTTVQADLDYASEHDEELLNNRLEHTKRRQRADFARAKVWPDVVASLTQEKEDDGTGLNLDGDHELTFGLGLSWEWGSRADRAKLRQALNDIRQNDADYFIVFQNKAQRLRELDRQLQETKRSVELQEQRVELVTRQVELFSDRWENGEIDILELIRSQNDLENTKVELISLKSRYMELLAEYEFAAGR